MHGKRSQRVFSEGGSAVGATVSTGLVLHCTVLHCTVESTRLILYTHLVLQHHRGVDEYTKQHRTWMCRN
jgi:hypothetical protein